MHDKLFEIPAADLALAEKLADALMPGYQVECDPEEAEQAGAFVEEALSEQEAMESTLDLPEALTVPLLPDGNLAKEEV